MSNSIRIGNLKKIKPLEVKKKRRFGPYISRSECSDVEMYLIGEFQDFLDQTKPGELLHQMLHNNAIDCTGNSPKFQEYFHDDPASMAEFFTGGYKFPPCWNTIPISFVNFMIVSLVDGLLIFMHKKVKKVEKGLLSFKFLVNLKLNLFSMFYVWKTI